MALNQTKTKELEQSTGHSVFSPSSMKRIILCPGSVLAELHAPIPKESVYAAEGTLLHEYCEEAFTKMPKNPICYVNEQNWKPERKVLVIDALTYVLKVRAKHTGPCTMTFEAKGVLDKWGMPEVYGTMDVRIISAERLDILDYKFGFGIQVFAQDNPQCGIYLASGIPFGYADGSKPSQSLHVHIVQPTLNHYDVWDVEWEELVSLIMVDVATALGEAKSDKPGYSPSMEACRWCNAKMLCDPRKNHIKTAAHKVIKAAKNPNALSKEMWKEVLDYSDDLQQAIKDARIYAQAEIRSGKGFPGYKIVSGRSNRVFRDKKVGNAFMLNALGEAKAYKPKDFITLAQAEKKLPGLKKDENWLELINKPVGKPVLVKESDKRAGLEFGAVVDFAEDAVAAGNVSAPVLVVGTDYH